MKRSVALGALVALGLLGAGLTALPGAPEASTALTPPRGSDQVLTQPSFADVIEAVSPAVVSIVVEQKARPMPTLGEHEREGMPEFFKRFFDHNPGRRFGNGPESVPVQGIGSGFIIDADGYVVTNNHVIGDAETITVVIGEDERYAATVVGRDPKTDLALLKIEAGRSLPYVAFADSSETRVGDWVVAVGSPFGLGKTATFGIVSAQGRGIGAGPYDDFLQIDAPINRGNSGGPSFNLNGEVIGVNTAIFSPSGGNVGIGFAIPASMAKSVVTDLKTHGTVERGWLGVAIQDVTPDIAESLDLATADGAIIARVAPDSPASVAGLRQGDVITAVDGEPIDDPRDLSRAVAAIDAGAATRLTVWRDGTTIEVSATIVRAAVNTADAAANAATEPAEVSALGVRVATLDDQARRAFGVGDAVTGVIVADVAPGSPAARKGIRPGDVVVSIANRPVSSAADVTRELEAAGSTDRDTVLVLLNREGHERFVALPLKAS